jgi:hypothetical protein
VPLGDGVPVELEQLRQDGVGIQRCDAGFVQWRDALSALLQGRFNGTADGPRLGRRQAGGIAEIAGRRVRDGHRTMHAKNIGEAVFLPENHAMDEGDAGRLGEMG